MTRPLKSVERTRQFRTITCRHCGRRRRVERENAKYCSDRCRKAAQRNRAAVQCATLEVSRSRDTTSVRKSLENGRVGGPKGIVPAAVTRTSGIEAERDFQRVDFRSPRPETPPRRKSPQKVPPGWLGAQRGDYLGELSMYVWPA